jgi:uncharacterized protein YqeY
MGLLETIKADALQARKAKAPEAAVLVTLIGEINTKTKSLAAPRDLTDEEIVAIVKKFIKNARDTFAAIAESRPEASIDIANEISVLERYLPSQISEEDIRDFAVKSKSEGLKMGEIMAGLKSAFPGQYDGKTASKIVKEVLEH